MSEISEAPLYIDDSPNLMMMEIRAKARRLKQKHDLKLIVIDYLQLMTSGKKVESRQQEVSEFSRQLKLLAKELEVPVVAMSQLNRGPEQRTDKKPMLSDLRESGAIEQDADMVILMHRPDAFERDDPRGGEADLILAKHRNGPTKTIIVAHQLHLSRFTNMAKCRLLQVLLVLQQQCIYLPDVVRCRSGSTPCYMPTRIGGNPEQADPSSRLAFVGPAHVRFQGGRLMPTVAR